MNIYIIQSQETKNDNDYNYNYNNYNNYNNYIGECNNVDPVVLVLMSVVSSSDREASLNPWYHSTVFCCISNLAVFTSYKQTMTITTTTNNDNNKQTMTITTTTTNSFLYTSLENVNMNNGLIYLKIKTTTIITTTTI